MKYPVVVTKRAVRDIDAAVVWWANHRSETQARRWYRGILNSIASLESRPERCPLADEQILAPEKLFELHYGLRRKPTHRALFVIRNETVLVLAVRHVSQDGLRLGDI